MYSNECYYCDCYDPDSEGCLMPSVDRMYACSCSSEYDDEAFIVCSTGKVEEHGTLEEMESLYNEKYKALTDEGVKYHTGITYYITRKPD